MRSWRTGLKHFNRPCEIVTNLRGDSSAYRGPSFDCRSGGQQFQRPAPVPQVTRPTHVLP
jgi:hypothetical protein